MRLPRRPRGCSVTAALCRRDYLHNTVCTQACLRDWIRERRRERGMLCSSRIVCSLLLTHTAYCYSTFVCMPSSPLSPVCFLLESLTAHLPLHLYSERNLDRLAPLVLLFFSPGHKVIYFPAEHWRKQRNTSAFWKRTIDLVCFISHRSSIRISRQVYILHYVSPQKRFRKNIYLSFKIIIFV